jgi:hypothetical protein
MNKTKETARDAVKANSMVEVEWRKEETATRLEPRAIYEDIRYGR